MYSFSYAIFHSNLKIASNIQLVNSKAYQYDPDNLGKAIGLHKLTAQKLLKTAQLDGKAKNHADTRRRGIDDAISGVEAISVHNWVS